MFPVISDAIIYKTVAIYWTTLQHKLFIVLITDVKLMTFRLHVRYRIVHGAKTITIPLSRVFDISYL